MSQSDTLAVAIFVIAMGTFQLALGAWRVGSSKDDERDFNLVAIGCGCGATLVGGALLVIAIALWWQTHIVVR